MTVYVDDMHTTEMGRFGRMKMSHMIADTREELLEMAVKLQLKPKWIQKSRTPHEHFDVTLAKRKLAVEHGAVEVTMRELAKMTRARRDQDGFRKYMDEN